MHLSPRSALALAALVALVGCRPKHWLSRMGCAYRRPELERRAPVQSYRSELSRAGIDARRLAIRMGGVALADRPAPEGPDVVLVVLDTFRADRLAAWGADPELAPNLNAFAEQARVYTGMRATGTWTLPSHGSLFTGLYPIEHGARGSPRDAATRAYGLSDDPPTLAERLAGAGWLTAGVAANQAFLSRSWSLDRGFDVWMCEDMSLSSGLSYPQGDRVSALAVEAVRTHRRQAALPSRAGHPLFLFVNYMDTHSPWLPREGYTAHPERIDPQVLPQGGEWTGKGRWRTSRRAVLSRSRPASEVELASWSEAYDAEVRFLDAQIGALLEGLAEAGIDGDDYIIVLSDHGEFLGEHALLEHSKDVYEEVLRVPLMIRGPGFEPGIDESAVQTHDVPELLLEALGLEPLVGAPDLEDTQVSELYWARHRDLQTPSIADRLDRIRRAFVDGEHKLILTEESEIGEDEAFDLGADPGELHSVLAEAPWVGGLRAVAAAWLEQRERTAGSDVALSPEEAERLRALGYLQ